MNTVMVRNHLSGQLPVAPALLVERLHGELAQLLAMALVHMDVAQQLGQT